MGTKTNPGAFDCYAAANPDEPLFVLLGRLVTCWDCLTPEQRLNAMRQYGVPNE